MSPCPTTTGSSWPPSPRARTSSRRSAACSDQLGGGLRPPPAPRGRSANRRTSRGWGPRRPRRAFRSLRRQSRRSNASMPPRELLFDKPRKGGEAPRRLLAAAAQEAEEEEEEIDEVQVEREGAHDRVGTQLPRGHR